LSNQLHITGRLTAGNLFKEKNMGKDVYTVNGKMYIVDDETGKILTIEIKDEPVPQRDHDEIIKILAKQAKHQKDG